LQVGLTSVHPLRAEDSAIHRGVQLAEL